MKVPKLYDVLMFEDSRKVGIATWFYISSEIFFYMRMIDVNTWMACKAMSLTLIGGGTIADRFLEKKDGKNPSNPVPNA